MEIKKRGLAVLAFTIMGGVSGHAAEISYVGISGGDWATSSNWSSGAYPTPSDSAVLNNTAFLDSDMSANNMLSIRIGNGAAGTFNLQAGGSVKATANSNADSHVGSGTGGNGTLNQSGGTADLNYLEIGRGATGLYSLIGGDLIIARGQGGHSLYLGTDDSKTVNNGDGTFKISGGTLMTRTGVYLGSSNSSGVGLFSVLGSGASQIGIGSQGSIGGSWIQNSGSTLSVRIDDTASGITRIFIDEVSADGGDVTFEDGALLDVGYTGAFTNGGTYTIMEWEGALTNNGLQFAPGVDAGRWSFNLDTENKKLEVTAVGAPLYVPKFAHPGIWHKRSDLDRMKHMVEAGIDPWADSFSTLSSQNSASYDYTVRKDPLDDSLSRENPRHQRNQYEDDAIAAYHNSLMWYITGDSRHADKVVEVLNAWSSLTNFYGGGTEPLCAGLYGSPLINAAEIIKSTYDGWAGSDIQAFKDMLVYPGYSNTTVPTADIANDNVTFYWRTYMGDPGRHGNQGLLAWRTVMAIGIFLDNEIIYDRALNNILGLPCRADDIPYPTGPPILNSTPNANSCEYFNEYSTIKPYRYTTISNYGYDDSIQHYIYDNGQCQESSRDQVHSSLGIGAITEMMEVAWNQGTDIYSFLDYRVLDGLEFTLKYNLSDFQTYPDQPAPWEPETFYQYTSRCGRWESLKINPWVAQDTNRVSRGEGVILRPTLELPAAHFSVRQAMTNEAKWTLRSRDYAINAQGYEEGDGTDSSGWGGLTYRRPDYCAGDPIKGFTFDLPDFGMHVLPGTIEASNYDFFSGTAEGRTYHDLTSTNTAGAYRSNDAVDIEVCTEGGYNLTDLEDGEWVSFTVNISNAGTHGISVRYAAAEEAAVRLTLGGSDLTGDVILPATGGSNVWTTYTVAQNLLLSAGVQSMRVYFSNTSESYRFKSITLAETAPGAGSSTHIEAEACDAQSGVDIADPCSDVGGGFGVGSISDGDWCRYDGLTLGSNALFSARVARPSGRPAVRIEVRVGSTTGPLAGSVDVPVTGGWQEWTTVSITLDPVAGSPSLYLIFVQTDTSSPTDMMNFNWFELALSKTPGGLGALPVTAFDIDVSWDAAAGASVYNLKRGTVSGGPYDVMSISSTETNFTDSKLQAGTHYFYVISAVYSGSESADSPEVSAVPSAPLNEGDVLIGEVGISPDGSGGQDFQILIAASELGHNYQVWTSTRLVAPDWKITSGVVPGNDGELIFDFPVVGIQTNLFYKLEAWRQ